MINMEEDVKLAIRAAKYWITGGICMDALITLPCGHIGNMGAPICEECTKALLKRLCEKMKEDDE